MRFPENWRWRSLVLLLLWVMSMVTVGYRGPVGAQKPTNADSDSAPVFVDTRKIDLKFKKALEPVNEGRYDLAIAKVQGLCERYPEYAQGWLMLGDLFLQTREWKSAQDALRRCIDLHPRLSVKSFHGLFRASINLGDYPTILEYYNRIPLFAKASNEQLRDLDLWRKQAGFGWQALKKPRSQRLSSAPPTLDGGQQAYLPCLCNNGQTMILTRRDGKGEDFFESQEMDGLWSQGQRLPTPVNSDLDEGGCWLSPDGQMLWFTGCYRDGGLGSCDLYYSIRNKGRWGAVISAGPIINSSAWDAHPTLSSDGLTLYFASNRKGSLGGSDLWFSTARLDSSGWPTDSNGTPLQMPWWNWSAMDPDRLTWSEPEPLDSSINTPYSENSPYLHPNGMDLYFASSGHAGMGNLDLYRSQRQYSASGSSRWLPPSNLGPPLNSYRDDMGMALEPDGRWAWFSREIPEGIRLMRVELDTASKPRLSPPDTFARPLPQQSETWVLQHVYFGVDQDQPLRESEPALQILHQWLSRNPEIRIEIQGHTDASGSPQHNLDLSKRRAENIRLWLIAQGCRPERITAQGYGSTQPWSSDDTPESRALNRRTQILVLP